MFLFLQAPAHPDVWTIVNGIAGSVSALAALATVLIATRAFGQARKDKKAEDEARRPDFSASGEIGANETEELHYLKIVFQNRGINPAAHIVAKVALIGQDFERLDTLNSDIVDTIHPISSFDIEKGDFHLDHEGQPHYLMMDLDYVDARTNKKYAQRIYRKWPGLSAMTSAPLLEVGRQEVEKIETALVPG